MITSLHFLFYIWFRDMGGIKIPPLGLSSVFPVYFPGLSIFVCVLISELVALTPSVRLAETSLFVD